MKVFRLQGVANQNMIFYIKNESDLYSGQFSTASNVTELLWQAPPELILRSAAENQRKFKGKKLNIPDIGYFTPGSLIISQKAEQCIGDYLRQFGDLNEISVEGESWYNYVVTNTLSDVVDLNASKKSRSGQLKQPAFHEHLMPKESQIFKLAEMQMVDIYFNDNGGDTIATLARDHQLEAGDMPLIWMS